MPYTMPMTAQTHLLYGEPPASLVAVPAGARQCSPLIVGSHALELEPLGSASSAVVYAPAGTVERRYVLARMLNALAAGAPLTALAPNDKGGNRIATELEAFGCDVVAESRSHHRILTTTRPATLIGTEEAITQGGQLQHPAHGLWTQAGVFSWDRIDAGSALLLEQLPELHGHGADLGCGIGVLARAMLQSSGVQSLSCIDIDRRAIDAARKNLPDARAQFLWADIRGGDLPFQPLDFVVMNPPFHDAGIEDKSLGQAFVTRAAALLKSGGTLWCVANRHLPYEALFASHFTHAETIAEADGYKIIRAEK
jgi:16S rRNA (guanine1207-N2)-methyltransferase